jgi:hypothetical protein
MLNLNDLNVRTIEHHQRVDNADRYGWLSPVPRRARRSIRPTLAPIARSAWYALTALTAVAFDRGLQ